MRKLVLTLVFIACIAYGYCRSFLAEDNARSAERVRQKLFARMSKMDDTADTKRRGEKRSQNCTPPHCQSHGYHSGWLMDKEDVIDAVNAKRGADYGHLGNQ